MSEVMLFDLRTHCLQVVPKACLIPIGNYVQVERLWGHEKFNLIDVGTNGYFMAMPWHEKIQRGNRYIATLHWDEKTPPHLIYERKFWLGPLSQCTEPPFHSFPEVRTPRDLPWESRCLPTQSGSRFLERAYSIKLIGRSPTNGPVDRTHTSAFVRGRTTRTIHSACGTSFPQQRWTAYSEDR